MLILKKICTPKYTCTSRRHTKIVALRYPLQCKIERLGQVHHTRLRLNCSSLHQNLFSKNIINDPYCECGEIEDTEHYLLNCNLYQNLREELLNTVTTYCQPTLNVLLYGNANLSDSENKTIFSAVQKFILKTKRF